MISPLLSRARLLAAVLVLSAAVAAGCGATTGANSPAATTPVSAAPAASAAPSAASSPATTTIDWGVIWDALPASFPAHAGAQPTETGAGPASAVLQVPATAQVAADFYRAALEAAGYRIEAVNGPLEDGSFVIDAAGTGACRVQVAVAPLGGVTVATVFYGAQCPFR